MQLNARHLVGMCALTLLLSGCTSNKEPAARRAPTDPKNIAILSAPPMNYDDLGIVEASDKVEYGEGFTADTVVDQLLAKAAQRGANALLLSWPRVEGTETEQMQVGGRYKGKWYLFTGFTKPKRTIVAKALFVK